MKKGWGLLDSETMNKVRAGSVCYFTYMLFFKGNTSVSPPIHPLKLTQHSFGFCLFTWCFPKAALTPLPKHYKQMQRKAKSTDSINSTTTGSGVLARTSPPPAHRGIRRRYIQLTFQKPLWGHGCMRIFSDCLQGFVLANQRTRETHGEFPKHRFYYNLDYPLLICLTAKFRFLCN